MSSHAGRILTTHVGSLPRPLDVTTTIFKAERGEFVDKAEHEKHVNKIRVATQNEFHSGLQICRMHCMKKILDLFCEIRNCLRDTGLCK